MSGESASVRCMILPLSTLNLVIPNSAVAEIIGYSLPQPLPATSDWFTGIVSWRGVYVPVVAVEEMCGIDTFQLSPRARIAIIYNPEKDEDIPYLGIQMQDIPRAYLAEASKMESANDDNMNQYLLSRVDDDQYSRAIPNMDSIIAELKLEFSQEKVEQVIK